MDQSLSIEERYLLGRVGDADLIRHFEARRAGHRKSQGAVYTPGWVVEAILDRIGLESPDQTVLEPACGHGAFLLPLIRRARARFGFSWEETRRWFLTRVRGIEIDACTAREMRTILAMLFQREGVMAARETDFINILTGDALDQDPGPVSIVLGNPPYVRSASMDPAMLAVLRDRFTGMRKGNVDLYFAFIEKFVAHAETCALIVPTGCLKAHGAARLRAATFPSLAEVVDFGAELVFDPVRAYTSILVFRRGHTGSCRVKQGLENPGRCLRWENLTGSRIHAARRATISGIATLRDDVFVVKRDMVSGTFTAHHEGRTWPIEAGLVRPLLRATKLAKLGPDLVPDEFVIFPYTGPGGRALLDEASLARDFPLAHAWLTYRRADLDRRDRGRTGAYPAWFAYGRTQGLGDLGNLDLVIVPRLVGGTSLPVRLETSGLTARFGAPLIVSGFAIPSGMAGAGDIVSPKFLDHVREHGAPRPGGFVAISSKHVNDFLAARALQDHENGQKVGPRRNEVGTAIAATR